MLIGIGGLIDHKGIAAGDNDLSSKPSIEEISDKRVIIMIHQTIKTSVGDKEKKKKDRHVHVLYNMRPSA